MVLTTISTKQHILTKVPVKCLFMVIFLNLKLLQKADQLSDTSGLGMS